MRNAFSYLSSNKLSSEYAAIGGFDCYGVNKMTQTKVKGWCAWHKEQGFLHTSFLDGTSASIPEKRVWTELRLEACSFIENETISAARLNAKLQSDGWEVRECYLTIEDI